MQATPTRTVYTSLLISFFRVERVFTASLASLTLNDTMLQEIACNNIQSAELLASQGTAAAAGRVACTAADNHDDADQLDTVSLKIRARSNLACAG